MIEFRINDMKIPMYHIWDIPVDGKILDNIKMASPKHIGWYIKYTDGSNLYTRIISVSGKVIGTDTGLLRRYDIIHCAIPKGRWCNYSGVAPSREHPLVRPYTRNEKSLATRLLSGEQLKYVTPRIKMNALERAKEHADKLGVGVEECVHNYIRLMKGNGNSALMATDRIMIINNVDPTKIPVDKASTMDGTDMLLTGSELRKLLNEGAISIPVVSDIRGMLQEIQQAEVVEETFGDLEAARS